MVRSSLIVAAFLLFIPSAYAGQDLGVWMVTRYYTPVPAQERYYNGWKQSEGSCKIANLYYAPYGGKYKGDYAAELCMQGQGDGFITADGTNLRTVKPFSIAACPREYLGETLHIAEIGYVKCRDTGGVIKGKKIDVWAGIGSEGYENIRSSPGGLLHVHQKL